jgi:hypothetical protein
MQADRQPPNSVIHHGGGTWRLWTSDGGGHYAVRAGVLTNDQLLAGYAKTLAADSPEELHHLLDEQPDAPESAGC